VSSIEMRQAAGWCAAFVLLFGGMRARAAEEGSRAGRGAIEVSRRTGDVWVTGTCPIKDIEPWKDAPSAIRRAFREAFPSTRAERALEPEIVAMLKQLAEKSDVQRVVADLTAGRLTLAVEGLRPWVAREDEADVRAIARYRCSAADRSSKPAPASAVRVEQTFVLLHSRIKCAILLKQPDRPEPGVRREVDAGRYVLVAWEQLTPRIQFKRIIAGFDAKSDEEAHARALRLIRALFDGLAPDAGRRLVPAGARTRPAPRAAVKVKHTERGNAVMLHLDQLFDNDGISSAARPTDGNFDLPSRGTGDTFPAEAMPSPGVVTPFPDTPDVCFTFPSAGDGKMNNIACSGHRILAPDGRYAVLWLLGAATDGHQSGTIVAEYQGADGPHPAAHVFSITDWCRPRMFDERRAYGADYRHTYEGRRQDAVKPSLWAKKIDLDAARSLRSLTLPRNPHIHIFALTLIRAQAEPAKSAAEAPPKQ